jgi:RpiB/LacA/LacB family sugar-phosphate isomerase
LDGDFGKRIEKAVEGAFGREGVTLRFESAGRAEERLVGSEKRSLKIAIGADHRGYELKRSLMRYLHDLGHLVVDCGIKEGETGDYPDIALRVSERVVRKDCDFGIVIDAVGIGSAIAANKIAGIRAAVCYDVEAARSSRLHNDANVLSLGAGFVNRGLARRVVRVWLETPFEGGRHIARIEKIAKLEKDGLDAGL